MSRFTFVKTDGLESYDLQIKGVTAADVGVYFCANTEKKNGVEHYSYGTKITSVELIGRYCRLFIGRSMLRKVGMGLWFMKAS